MAELPTPDVDGYVGGNSQACHAQFIEFVEADSSSRDSEGDLYRAFAFEIASQVGGRYCRHVEEPPALEDMSLAKKKKAAANHPGLCGVYHAAVIAGVKTQDVVDKWGTTTANKYRNQVSPILDWNLYNYILRYTKKKAATAVRSRYSSSII